ncbi:MAG: Hsp20/alpha crystallin family protein [Myxococcota bacterium]|nr:Hsp20/alpha crystallin family protein [Myxococcota bacterium]
MSEKEQSGLEPFDPFREFDLFRAFGRPWPLPGLVGRFEGLRERWSPSVDVSEDDGHYVVTAELPGAKKDDVTVELQDNLLTIRGEKKSEREEKKEQRRYVERVYGSFSRSFTLPANADGNRMNAVFKDGVLTVEIAKREEPKPKTIAVK